MKRQTLVRLTGFMVVAGGSIALVPLVKSMMPTSLRVEESTLEVDVSTIAPGEYIKVRFKETPVVVFRVDNEVIHKLASMDGEVWGPATNIHTDQKYFVYEAVSTYRGCGLRDTKGIEFYPPLPPGWWDNCHMGAWDYSGRAYKDVNVPKGVRLENLRPVSYREKEKGVIQLVPDTHLTHQPSPTR